MSETAPKIVRMKQSPVPSLGLVKGEGVTMLGQPCWFVQVYGYSLAIEAWVKEACWIPTESIPPYINIEGWLALAKLNSNGNPQ